MGPLQFMVIGFEGNRFTGEIMPELNALRERDVIRILDLVFVSRGGDGEVNAVELHDLTPSEEQVLLDAVDDEPGEWFAQDDIDQIGETLPADSSVAMLLVEHRWARPVEDAIGRAHGTMLAEGMIPRELAATVEGHIQRGARQ